MNAATSVSRVPDIQTLEESLGTLRGLADVEAKARESAKRQMEQWLDWMDGILDVHRSNFVFREAPPAQLAEHETALSSAIEYCGFIKTLVDDPGFNEPDLASRLEVRIRLLQDAYDTFHDATLSDAQADKVLKQVFPE
jgi:hypothetical protein